MNTPIKVTSGKDLIGKGEAVKTPPFEAVKTHEVDPPKQEKPAPQGVSGGENTQKIEEAIAKQRAEFEAKKAAMDADEAEMLRAHKERIAKLTADQNRQVELAEKELDAHKVNHAERIEALRSAAEDELDGVAAQIEATKNAKVSNPKGRPIPVQEPEYRPRHISEIGAGYNGKADTIEEVSD